MAARACHGRDMRTLFEARVDEASAGRVRIALRVASAEVTRLWTSKTFALSLLLEPILLAGREPPPALTAVLPLAAIKGYDLAAWKRAAPKIVTACTIDGVAPPLPAFREELAALDGTGVAALLASDRVPVATITIRVKAGMAAHLAAGLTWSSGACDLP